MTLNHLGVTSDLPFEGNFMSQSITEGQDFIGVFFFGAIVGDDEHLGGGLKCG